MDLFEEYLIKQDNGYVKRALTDTSFNAFRCRGVDASNPQFDALHTPLPTNFDMATYGDSILKMILTGFLWNDTEKPTVEKSGLESDLMLVEVIARNYGILKYLKYDTGENDPCGSNHLPQNYDYRSTDDTNKNPHKYIATCVEAMIAAIYLDSPKENFEKLRQLITEQWVPMIQSSAVFKDWRSNNIVKKDNKTIFIEKLQGLSPTNALQKFNEVQSLPFVPKCKFGEPEKTGPEHNLQWTVTCTIDENNMVFTQTGHSKQVAKNSCAYDLLKYLIEN